MAGVFLSRMNLPCKCCRHADRRQSQAWHASEDNAEDRKKLASMTVVCKVTATHIARRWTKQQSSPAWKRHDGGALRNVRVPLKSSLPRQIGQSFRKQDNSKILGGLGQVVQVQRVKVFDDLGGRQSDLLRRRTRPTTCRIISRGSSGIIPVLSFRTILTEDFRKLSFMKAVM